MKSIIPISLMLLLVTACKEKGQPAQSVPSVPGSDYQVELLFEIDGCKMYRFYDGDIDRPRYFTTCPGSVTWDENHSSGKHSHIHPEQITTSPAK